MSQTHEDAGEHHVGPDKTGMGTRGGKGPTAAASSETPGAFGDALGRHGKGGVHVPDEQGSIFDEVAGTQEKPSTP